MPLPQQTFSTFEQLVNYINTFIIPNGDAEITGNIHNNVANGLSTWLQNAALNSGLVRIYNGGGVISVDHNIDAFTTVVPTSVSWPDNFVKEYYFVNATSSAIPLADGFSYSNIFFEIKTDIPAFSILHIAKATNGSWIQVSNVGAMARNGLSAKGGFNVLGQDVGESGNPAILLSNREIPLDGHTINFIGDGSIVLHKALFFPADPQVTLTNSSIVAFDPTDFTRTATLRAASLQLHANASIGGDVYATVGIQGSVDRTSLLLATNFRVSTGRYSALFIDDHSIGAYADGIKIGNLGLTSLPFTLDVANKTLIIDGVTGAFPGQMKISSSDGVTDVSFINVIDPSETFQIRLPVTSPTGTVKMQMNNSAFRFERTGQGIFQMNFLDCYFQPTNPDSTKIGYVCAGKQIVDAIGTGPTGINESNSVTTNFSYPTSGPFTYSIPFGVKGMFFDFIFAGNTTPGSEATFIFDPNDVPFKKGVVGTAGGFIRDSNVVGGEAVRLTCIGAGNGATPNWSLQVLDGSSFANWSVN